ncbi:hypothetical protein D3C87_1774970 [compost metagenome]
MVQAAARAHIVVAVQRRDIVDRIQDRAHGPEGAHMAKAVHTVDRPRHRAIRMQQIRGAVQ